MSFLLLCGILGGGGVEQTEKSSPPRGTYISIYRIIYVYHLPGGIDIDRFLDSVTFVFQF